ncbi:DUF1298 domain-containing protein [Gordonia amarae]|uniref:O-acyltransferase WSD1 C-terminal domain-containing protein n=2 Tax=Gordonia amarae TaxID=36821 RepID=G7GV82_9ACTN|nr:WS/DGAT domain-containing protein [Gordonia amarae]MCS3879981.1 hypothetical protein [Gordonia amarae]QHN18372.1 DUF1298 domain-containing protein [Gordonia amarae]QHN22854.1 DUF1298 domain-containing protein [Gordonia amarae]QHN31757.1 DUF1298 domain-containing protein [Gordonia amarae]QHN40503.1 DUF1298 domain-containing protein [Gordonia amarae]
MERMSAIDAATYWRSAILPSDQFVVYVFGVGPGADPLAVAAAELRDRVRAVDDLRLRVLAIPGDLDRPHWMRADPGPESIVLHRAATWQGCLDSIAGLIGDQLDPAEYAWRIHLFGPVSGVPRLPEAAGGHAVVAVLQICHALADGRGTADIGRALFGAGPGGESRDDRGVAKGVAFLSGWGLAALGAARLPRSVGTMVWQGMRSFAEYQKAEATESASESAVPQPVTDLNRRPGRQRSLRTIVLDRRSLPAGHSVTVAALTAISFALDELLGAAPHRAAELTVGTPVRPGVRNNFRNVAVDLHVETDDVEERMALIADEVATAQRAASAPDPVAEAAGRAESATPAFLAHWGVRQLDVRTRPATVTGATVVSSVNRGPADLTLAGGQVLFTTGFPALSPAQGLTHGVHGIGRAVAISVTTSPEIVDADSYLGMLRRALDRIATDCPLHP